MKTEESRPGVLVVEDDPLVRFALAQSLSDAGIVALEAGNSNEALSLLAEADDIRVVVTDIDMPGSINGLGLARILTDAKPYVHVILISGVPLSKDTRLPPGTKFIQKPFSFDQLNGVVRGLLSDG
jgi:two-component system, response regulator PdtaR